MMLVRKARCVATQMAFVLGLSPALPLFSQKPPDHPRWAVYVAATIDSKYIDEPICHSLEFFSSASDPQRFDYDHELALRNIAIVKDTVDSAALGAAAGFGIRQVIHAINDNVLAIKMILVERKAGEFCEIYHQQFSPDFIRPEPAFLVHDGPETVLASTDPWSGNSGQRQDIYWTFDKEGPRYLDVDGVVEEALKQFRPKGFIILNQGGFDIRTLTYEEPLWKPRDPHCCPTGGSMEIKFVLKDHQLVPVSHSYKKN
ncbi:MAG: hypothetical protein WCA94_02800 [Candidatus Acidiferrum sp.]|jgi:hypothetical protein